MKKLKLQKIKRNLVKPAAVLKRRSQIISTTSPNQSKPFEEDPFENLFDEETAQPFINDLEKEEDLDDEINRDDKNVEELEQIMHGPKPSKYYTDLDEAQAPTAPRRNKVMQGVSPKFFYILRKKKNIKKVAKKTLIPVNEEILELAKKSKRPFIKRMSGNLKAVRSFVIFNLAPATLPLMSAIDEARDTIKEITTDPVASPIYGMLVRLALAGVEVKSASFVATYLKLNKEERIRFFERIESDRRYQKELSELQKVRSLQSAVERVEAFMHRLPALARKGKVTSS